MTAATDRLAEIDGRAEAATGGPWTIDEHGGLRIYGPDGGMPLVISSNETIAAFIAHARTDVPALTSALRAVLALHVPYPLVQHMIDGDITACSVCGDVDDNPEEYPCPTVTAIATALSASEAGR